MKIQPTTHIQTPLAGQATDIDIQIQPFMLFPSQIEVQWTVYGEGFSEKGTLLLPQSVVNQWGTDDNVVKNYVLQELNLTELIENP